MKHIILIITLAATTLAPLTLTYAQQPLTLTEKLLIQQVIIQAEQADDLDYIAQQIRRAKLLEYERQRNEARKFPLTPR